jgi:tyrosinase
MALRKNQRNLTDWEKNQFTDALLRLKAEQISPKPPDPPYNTYDRYVKWHFDSYDASHKGPGFFAWHREFLRRFELELQRITNNPFLGLPYWDWSVDRYPDSSIWESGFMGGNGRDSDGKVMDGPFAYDAGRWTLNIRSSDEPTSYLRRQFEKDTDVPSLPTEDDVQAALRATPFDVDHWNEYSASGFRNMAEGFIPPNTTPMGTSPGCTTAFTRGSVDRCCHTPRRTTPFSSCTTVSLTSCGPTGRNCMKKK